MEKALKNIIIFRDNVLNALNGKMEGFCLAGGTALSLFYFRHRESFDLDFFTKTFSEKRIMDIISVLSESAGVKKNIIKKANIRNEARMIVCEIPVKENEFLATDDIRRFLKIDFVEDVYRDIASRDVVINGIKVMSQENIYLRKIYAAFGVVRTTDVSGKEEFSGGRQEAKDIFDLYYLSNTFIPLSRFMDKYCTLDEKVSAVTWHRRYDRFSMRAEMLDIVTDKKIDVRAIEKHFDLEIENIIKQIAGEA